MPPLDHMSIISPLFPWVISIQASSGGFVTLGDILYALHDTLHELVLETEWWITSVAKRAQVSAAHHRNRNYSGRSRKAQIRRIDWLSDQVIMTGLTRDESFIAQRMSDPREHRFTWVLATRATRMSAGAL